ncbi:MAG: zinc ribbon domain-containing protein [Thermodesulfobacteriota bacterium]
MIKPPISSPSCQSCGVNIKKPTEFGTTATKVIDVNYCRYCLWNGEFTEPDITMEEMIEKVAKTMIKTKRVSPEQAEEMARKLIPTLKRWQIEA